METKKEYDWLIVGSGLFGATFAYQMTKAGKRCFVIDRRPNYGGNVYCEMQDGVLAHKYGAHIFHTDRKEIWDFVNGFVHLRPVVHSPLAVTEEGAAFPLPFNMYTFGKLWPEVVTPVQAKKKIEQVTKKYRIENPSNLEEKALSLVGDEIYEKFIKGYTEKQWGRKCTELPPDIITRIPLRFSYDNNYFTDRYEGIPEEGYNPLVKGLLDGAVVRLGVDYFDDRKYFNNVADNVLFTGCIDAFFGYRLGKLDYRSLRFQTLFRPLAESQGCSVVNYTGSSTPYTRVIEHNFFAPQKKYEEIVQTREFPALYDGSNEPFYPITDSRNKELYNQYASLAESLQDVYFGGRLGMFKYMDMDDAISGALTMAKRFIK